MPSDNIVYVIDDDEAMRKSLGFLLRTAKIEVQLFEAAAPFLEALPKLKTGCIITDVRMPGMTGIELLKRLRQLSVTLPVIVITGHGDIALAVEAMKNGAADFLEKPLDRRELLSAVRSAMDTVTQSVSFPRDALSHAEVQVLRLFLEGRTSKETATILNRSTRTVEAHRHNLMRKFGVHNAVQLAQKASALWSAEFRFDHVPDRPKGRAQSQPPHTEINDGA